MLFTSSSQLIVLVLLFFGGLVIGMGLRSGGSKWRKRFNDESGNYAQFRRDADLKLRTANGRVAELERENAELREARSVADTRPVVTEPASVAPVAAASAVPAFAPEPRALHDTDVVPEPVTDRPKNSWFSTGQADLGHIRGIDADLKSRLAELDVTRFEDITGLSAEDEMALEQRLALPAGYITREQWREQAALLQDGKDAEHAERFPAR